MNDFTDISVNHNFLHILNPKALGISSKRRYLGAKSGVECIIFLSYELSH